MPTSSTRRNEFQSGCSKASISERGAILPLTAILVALVAALLIGVTQTMHSSSRENILGEEQVHEKMKVIFEESTQLNAIANINLVMAERAMELLETLQKLISWGFNIASTTPLWEQSLPIPEKYDLFRKIDIALAPLVQDFDNLSELQLHHRKKLKIIQDKSAFQISLLQSLCILKCIKNQTSITSSASCDRPSANTNVCHLNLNAHISPWTQQRSLALSAILTHTIAQRPGFMLTDPDLILELGRQSFAPPQSAQTPRDNNTLVGIVHPRLCAHPRNAFRVPCKAQRNGVHHSQKNHFVLAFEPHWSVAVEF
jgi:hypothetical protein